MARQRLTIPELRWGPEMFGTRPFREGWQVLAYAAPWDIAVVLVHPEPCARSGAVAWRTHVNHHRLAGDALPLVAAAPTERAAKRWASRWADANRPRLEWECAVRHAVRLSSQMGWFESHDYVLLRDFLTSRRPPGARGPRLGLPF